MPCIEVAPERDKLCLRLTCIDGCPDPLVAGKVVPRFDSMLLLRAIKKSLSVPTSLSLIEPVLPGNFVGKGYMIFARPDSCLSSLLFIDCLSATISWMFMA